MMEEPEPEPITETMLQIMVDMEEANRWQLLWHAVRTPVEYSRALRSHLEHRHLDTVNGIARELASGMRWWRRLWHHAWNARAYNEARAVNLFMRLTPEEQESVINDLMQTAETPENR